MEANLPASANTARLDPQKFSGTKKKKAKGRAATRIVVKTAFGYCNNWKGYAVEPNESDGSVEKTFPTVDEANEYVLKFWDRDGLEEYQTFRNSDGFVKVTIVDGEGAPAMVWAEFERPEWLEADDDGKPLPQNKEDKSHATDDDHDEEQESDEEEVESNDEEAEL